MTIAHDPSDQDQLTIEGASCPGGSQWIKVNFANKRSRWLPYASFRKNGAAAEALLADQGLIFMNKEFKHLMQLAQDLTSFPERTIAAQIGWAGNSFALPSGRLITPDDAAQSAIAFTPVQNRDQKKGSAKRWKKEVAGPLSGQPLATFIMMIPFAAPLLKIIDHPTNFGFEIAGRGGIGKSTICKLAVSAIGPIDNMTVSMNATANLLDQLMAEFRDQLLMLEEWNIMALHGGASAGREAARLAFTMADGTRKRRYDTQAEERVRFLWLASTNRPLPSMLEGVDAQTAQAALDRTLTLEITGDRKHGVFDGSGGKYSSVSAMAQGLIESAASYHGAAFIKFLGKLTEANAEDEHYVRQIIVDLQQMFVERVKQSPAAHTHKRVMEAFGLVYAAGWLAKAFGVLPKSYSCMKAAKAAYRLHVESRSAMATPIERLLRLLDGTNLIDLREADELTDKEIEAANGLLRLGWSKGDELLLTRAQLDAITPNRTGFLKDPVIKAIMIREEKRAQVYRYVTPGSHRQRFFCFSLGALQDQGYL